ncbi:MAG: hypothetical protein ACTSVA_03040 [Candidatus Njordarchaeales archaeon]
MIIRKLNLKIALAGVLNLPSESHMMDNHIVKAAIAEGMIPLDKLEEYKNAKNTVTIRVLHKRKGISY